MENPKVENSGIHLHNCPSPCRRNWGKEGGAPRGGSGGAKVKTARLRLQEVNITPNGVYFGVHLC